MLIFTYKLLDFITFDNKVINPINIISLKLEFPKIILAKFG